MTEKQVVPKHVADWIKFCKDNGFRILEVMSPYGSAMRDYLEDFGAVSESIGFYIDNSYDGTILYEPFRYNDVQRHFEVVGNIYENENMIGYGDNNE